MGKYYSGNQLLDFMPAGWQYPSNDPPERSGLEALAPGDLVRLVTKSDSYVVTANYGDRVTAIRSVDLTNAAEWEVYRNGSWIDLGEE